MYYLFTDETNTNSAPSIGVKFFVYGGLIIPIERVSAIHDTIKIIRNKYGFDNSDDFKFDTRSRPKQVSAANFAKSKNDVLNLCINNNCKFIAYIVHHEIARDNKLEDYIEWGANTVIGKFNHFLRINKCSGYVMIDRLPNKNEYSYLAEKFSKGLLVNNRNVMLDHIQLFASTCNNASHLSSAMDIVLGAFRYAINSPKNVSAASEMMKKLAKLIWSEKISEDKFNPFEKGIILRPKSISFPSYKSDYDELIANINRLLR